MTVKTDLRILLLLPLMLKKAKDINNLKQNQKLIIMTFYVSTLSMSVMNSYQIHDIMGYNELSNKTFTVILNPSILTFGP